MDPQIPTESAEYSKYKYTKWLQSYQPNFIGSEKVTFFHNLPPPTYRLQQITDIVSMSLGFLPTQNTLALSLLVFEFKVDNRRTQANYKRSKFLQKIFLCVTYVPQLHVLICNKLYIHIIHIIPMEHKNTKNIEDSDGYYVFFTSKSSL